MSNNPDSATLARFEAFIRENKLNEAKIMATDLKQQYPNSVAGYYALGQISYLELNWHMARDYYLEALDISPNSPDILYNLALVYNKLDEQNHFENTLKIVLKIKPDHIPALISNSYLYVKKGNTYEAIALLRKVLKLSSNNIFALHALINLITVKPNSLLTDIVYKNYLTLESPEERALSGFTLAKIYMDQKYYQKAYIFYNESNTILYTHRSPTLPEPVDIFQGWKNTCSRFFFKKRFGYGIDDTSQVFILGPSRSGKSLVESIIGCHPEVIKTGESRKTLFAFQHLTGSTIYNAIKYVQSLTAEQSKIDALYCLTQVGIKNRLKTITLPENLFLLGLVGLLFPKTPIIFCKRSLLDLGISIYFRYYECGNQYSFDLKKLGQTLFVYESMMNFWLKRLPNPMLVVHYENLAKDPEKNTRRIFEFLNLELKKEYFTQQKKHSDIVKYINPGISLDLPVPINSDLVGVSKHFRKNLAPLVDGYFSMIEIIPMTLSKYTLKGEDTMQPIIVEKLGAATLRDGLIRIQCIALGADGQEKNSGELAIPASQFENIINSFQNMNQQLQQNMQKIDKAQE